jgi:hypothetical protein
VRVSHFFCIILKINKKEKEGKLMVKEIKKSDVVTFDLLYEDYLKKVIVYLEDKDCWRIEEKNPGSKLIDSNCIFILNTSKRLITIIYYHKYQNCYLSDDQLFYGLIIKHPSLIDISNKIELLDYLKYRVSEELLSYFLKTNKGTLFDQKAKIKDLKTISMLKYLWLDKSERIKYDHNLLKICETLFERDNVKNTVADNLEDVALSILNNKFNRNSKYLISDYAGIFPKETILESFGMLKNHTLNIDLRKFDCISDIYNLFFVNNNYSTSEEVEFFKRLFCSFFFSKVKKPNDSFEFYTFKNEFLHSVGHLSFECYDSNCKHVDGLDSDYNSEHNKLFDNLQFCFKEALRFLGELEESPIFNIQSISTLMNLKFTFDLNYVSLEGLVFEYKFLKSFAIPVYKNIKEKTDLKFVFSERLDSAGLLQSSERLDKQLAQGTYDEQTVLELFSVIDEVLSSLSEIVEEDRSQEIEILKVELLLWKKKFSYFNKVNKKELIRFV